MKIMTIVVMSLLFVISLGGPAFAAAVSDNGGAAGDACVAGTDLKKAHMIVYPTVAATLPEFASVGIQMETSSKLPGLIALDIDVDNNTATPSGIYMGLSNLEFPWCKDGSDVGACASATGVCKTGEGTPYGGIDFHIEIQLRDNGPNAFTAVCVAGTCGSRDEAQSIINGCDTGSGCYVFSGTPCVPDTDDCYVIGESCETGTDCIDMSVPCVTGACCGTSGRQRGEWFVSSTGFGIIRFARGRIDMPPPGETGVDTETCFVLPWDRIVQAAFDRGVIDSAALNYAKNNPPKWQMGIYYDPVFSDEDDYSAPEVGLYGSVNIADWIPNADNTLAEADEGNPGCINDLNQDGVVNPADTNILFGIFPRSMLKDPCPVCF